MQTYTVSLEKTDLDEKAPYAEKYKSVFTKTTSFQAAMDKVAFSYPDWTVTGVSITDESDILI